MSSRQRLLSVCVVGVFWGAWLSALWAGYTHDVGAGHKVATELLMLAAGLSTVLVMFDRLIAPLVATAQVWIEVGRRQQAAECSCEDIKAVVIPFPRVAEQLDN